MGFYSLHSWWLFHIVASHHGLFILHVLKLLLLPVIVKAIIFGAHPDEVSEEDTSDQGECESYEYVLFVALSNVGILIPWLWGRVNLFLLVELRNVDDAPHEAQDQGNDGEDTCKD